MKLLMLLLATLMYGNIHTFKKVWVNDSYYIENVQLLDRYGKLVLLYNGKKIDDRYSIVSCRKDGGYCLIDCGYNRGWIERKATQDVSKLDFK